MYLTLQETVAEAWNMNRREPLIVRLNVSLSSYLDNRGMYSLYFRVLSLEKNFSPLICILCISHLYNTKLHLMVKFYFWSLGECIVNLMLPLLSAPLWPEAVVPVWVSSVLDNGIIFTCLRWLWRYILYCKKIGDHRITQHRFTCKTN